MKNRENEEILSLRKEEKDHERNIKIKSNNTFER
jgi:hypothetical protein